MQTVGQSSRARILARAVLGLVTTIVTSSCTVQPPAPSPVLSNIGGAGNTLARDPHQLPLRVAEFCSRLGWLSTCQLWEYTDDQRWDTGENAYGPLAHIAPSPLLDSMTIDSFEVAAGSGRLVAVVVVDTVPRIALQETYARARLVGGNHCVYLGFQVVGGDTSWSAYVTPEDPTASPPCPQAAGLVNSLNVHVVRHARFQADTDVAPVARFHEGMHGAQMQAFFGVKCANAWCMIIPTGTDTLPLPHAGLNPRLRTWEVHGWGDAQRLGVLDPGGRLVLSNIRASVIPAPHLGAYRTGDYAQRRHVASVYFPELRVSNKYTEGWLFRSGTNRILATTGVTSPAPEKTGQTSTPAAEWRAIVRRTRVLFGWLPIPFLFEERQLAVERRDHGTYIRGTARFRWDEQDEGVWFACDDGCCRISGT